MKNIVRGCLINGETMNLIENKKHELLAMWALFLSSSGTWVYSILMPVLTDVYKEFPCSQFWQGFIITGPSLVAIPVLLITGLLAKRISKKTLLIINLVVFIVGGVGGAFVSNLTMLIISRILSGVPAIVILVPTLSIISELWKDEKRRSKIVGYYYGFSGAYGAALSFASGIIATFGWRNSFLLNGIAIIAFVMVVAFVPKTLPEGKRTPTEEFNETVNCNQTELALNKKGFVLLMTSLTIMSIFGFAMYYLMSVYVEERALGGSVYIGTLGLVMEIAVSVVSFAFGFIYNKLKKWMHPLIFISMGLLNALLIFNLGGGMTLIVFAFLGAGMTIAIDYYPTVIPNYVPQSKITLFMSIYEAVTYGAMFLCAYVPMMIGSITGNYTCGFACIWMSVILLGVGLFLLFRKMKLSKGI